MKKGYTSEPLSFNRKMVAASAAVTARRNTIHSVAEVDITEPRKLIREHEESTGEKLSFTAYIVHCLAQVISHHPYVNAFKKGNRLITLEDVTISVLVEREFMGEKVPEPIGIKAVQELTFLQINDKIRKAQQDSSTQLGKLTGMAWIRFIPGFLLKTFIRIADRNIKLAKRYGKIGVTAVGMFSREPIWFIPHGSGTVLVTVGSIEHRTVLMNGKPIPREFLCLTVSFDHDIIDGAPAARFLNQFIGTLKSGVPLQMLSS